MTTSKTVLPLGYTDFTLLRQNNAVYVDKTDLLYELASEVSHVFLARPRRFGKSLLTSTLDSLFSRGLRDFRDLAIEKRWEDRTYNVVRLDFFKCKFFHDIEEFLLRFHATLRNAFAKAGFKFSSDSPDDMETQLSTWMSSLERGSLVVLIDEYDAPLTACPDNIALFEAVRQRMSYFFGMIKSDAGCLRFLFLTGITKFSSTSIFSEFNNLIDISHDQKYGTLLGYTEDEIHRYFSTYLDHAAKTLKKPLSNVLDNLKTYYNGFCFEETASQRVYCPWSVLNFLHRPERGFINYWFASGGHPTVLLKYLKGHELEDPASFAEPKVIRLFDLDASRQYEKIEQEVLLAQAGYLTIKEIRPNNDVILGHPNQEVAMSMAQLYADKLLDGKSPAKKGKESLEDILKFADTEKVVARFNEVFNAVNYGNYPIRDEALCCSHLQQLMMGEEMVPQVEVHTAHGRSDLEVEAGDRHWVFELKYAKESSQVEKLLEQAVEQIRNRRYGETPHGKELRRVALVFNAEDRRFTAWQDVEVAAK